MQVYFLWPELLVSLDGFVFDPDEEADRRRDDVQAKPDENK